MNYVTLNDPADFDLSQHGWIEASAGTGKTYTIERLVIRAIVEKGIPVSGILAVTYTEKAAGELKDRIRSSLMNIVQDRLTGADRRWFDAQIKKQGQGGQDRIYQIVQASLNGFDEAAIFTIHGFCQSILREYAFELGRLFQYELVHDSELRETLVPSILRRLPHEEGPQLKELLETVEFWAKDRGRSIRFENRLHELIRLTGDGTEIRMDDLPVDSPIRLLVRMAGRIEHALKDHKAGRGLISYDDMISQVHQAVVMPSGQQGRTGIADTLGRRYDLAIIDEFQDTDNTQWDIFRSCFLETSDPVHGRLILVGDPKQSIYGFRGADLNAFFEARNYFQGLHQARRAGLYRIETNFRASQTLIGSINALFSADSYPWKAIQENDTSIHLSYTQVHAPDDDRWAGTTLPEGRTAITLWTTEETAASSVRLQYARFICSEISHLIQGGLKLVKDRKPVEMDFAQICVLVRNSNDARFILEQLRSVGIPSTYYKQTGVFQSVEALEILYVLEALAEPSRSAAVHKALLTRFFGFSIEMIQGMEELPIDHPGRERLLQWEELATEGRWPQLFRQMLVCDEVPRQIQAEPGRWERTLTNYEQIMQGLEERALKGGLDLVGVIRCLKQLVRDESTGEEETLHRQETEESRVKVMTIHASKGLEFPVVFIYGGLTAGHDNRFYRFVESGKRVVVPVPWYESEKEAFKKSENAQAYRELDRSFSRAEDARLYYVALTRAALLCYLPMHRPLKMSGPLGTFMQDAIEATVAEFPALFRRLTTPTYSEKLDTDDTEKQPHALLERPVLPQDLPLRKADLYSYSALMRNRSERIDREEWDHDTAEPDTISEESPEDALIESLNQNFRGAEAGNFFHEILERLDFQDPSFQTERPQGQLFADLYPVLSVKNRSIIRRKMEQYGYRTDRDLEEHVATLLHRVMRTEILPGLFLRDLSIRDRIHELEFVFCHEGRKQRANKGEAFFTGFIDLVFRHQERVYLLDWKTNLLPGYGPMDLKDAMKSHQYDLQYTLYAKALRGWLESRGRDADREFGGVLYLFLRGVHPDSSDGIYFAEASGEQIEQKLYQEIRL